jgi:hypothetical protein
MDPSALEDHNNLNAFLTMISDTLLPTGPSVTPTARIHQDKDSSNIDSINIDGNGTVQSENVSPSSCTEIYSHADLATAGDVRP